MMRLFSNLGTQEQKAELQDLAISLINLTIVEDDRLVAINRRFSSEETFCVSLIKCERPTFNF